MKDFTLNSLCYLSVLLNGIETIEVPGGRLYTWGCGEAFRLGHNQESNEYSPRLVEYFSDRLIVVQQVSCGSTHTAALTGKFSFSFSFL
jgi:alpha-tubulin suppressor-like RCC1 family protein